MPCNCCAKPYSLLRKEKGCPGCGFSYCSNCLNNKVFLPKLNFEAKVCAKCKLSTTNEPKKIEPPDAYYKRLGLKRADTSNPNNISGQSSTMGEQNTKDQEILTRLRKLKEDSKAAGPGTSEKEIAKRLQKIKGDMPSATDAELQERLAKLRGVPISVVQSKAILPTPDLRTEQQQSDDLMRQYMEQANMDSKYKDEFDGLVSDIENRLTKLKGAGSSGANETTAFEEAVESEDEEESVKKIVARVKAEASEDDEIPPPTNDELPFCEICNEDAKMRCLGCRYLFCKRCFLEHKDDDDECNRYEPYTPPKGYQY